MSHRSAKLARRAGRTATPAAPVSLPGEPNVHAATTTAFMGWGSGQGYNAADQSTMRGFVYFPQLDTRKELTTYTRTEVLRRARYLDANVGFAGRIINGLSRMVAGTGLMIRPTTDDREWNTERQKLFEERNGSRYVFDTGGRWDFYSSQRGVMRCRYRDGDIGGAFVKSESGLARCSFFEAHRISSGRLSTEEMDRVIDGVLVDRNNAAQGYRIVGDHDTQSDIPVGQFFYVGDYASAGKHRTPSILHRACNHLLDVTEINAATKKGIKISNQIAYYIGQAAGTTGGGIPPMGENANPKVQVEVPDGTKRTLEQLLSQGGEIPGLPPGSELKQLLDERPHPNSVEFLKSLARDICWGTDMSPEVLWDIAALGGANTRFVMADAQSFIDLEQQNLADSYVCRYYIFDTALEIAAGRIRRPRDPQWWKHAVIPPARWTVDRGKDGKLYLEQVRSGALTFRRMFGWDGLESQSELGEWLDEMKFIGDEAAARGLDREKTLDRIYGRPGTAAQPAADPSPDRPTTDS
ncbi:MAG TPA: phage portal protein [Chthonomonadales bacterium]|nr:phage portal protein [Chthonomonadales bacterium]